ncbi:hypothetical protein [Methylobacterium radiodurans]|nr:hypothetical protein [Methylobacterium radiodurans]
MAVAEARASLPDMVNTRIKLDVSALRRAGITRAKELRSALDEAALYLAASARKRLREVAAEVFDRPTQFTLDAFRYRKLQGEAPAQTMKSGIAARRFA